MSAVFVLMPMCVTANQVEPAATSSDATSTSQGAPTTQATQAPRPRSKYLSAFNGRCSPIVCRSIALFYAPAPCPAARSHTLKAYLVPGARSQSGGKFARLSA